MSTDSCFKNGKQMKVNDTYVTNDCQSLCYCLGANDIGCVPLCTQENIACKWGETAVSTWYVKDPETMCRCQKKSCKKNGKTYFFYFIGLLSLSQN